MDWSFGKFWFTEFRTYSKRQHALSHGIIRKPASLLEKARYREAAKLLAADATFLSDVFTRTRTFLIANEHCGAFALKCRAP